MRKQLRYILFACTLYCGVNSYAQNVSINKNGAAPDNSAMLDVSDTAKGILVPRLTFVQRNLISNPATGLLIFQTDSDSGFYYNQGTAPLPVWVRLITSANKVTELSDADNDTKIQLDKTNDDDLIRFDTKGSEVMRIDSLGNVSIGSAPSVSYHKLSVSTDKIGGGFRLNQETDTAGSEVSFFNNSLFKWSLGSMNDSNALGESFFLYNNDRGVMDLFVDGDNGNTGIGTTDPQATLHLYGKGSLGAGTRLVFGDDYLTTSNSWNTFIGELGWDSLIDSDILQVHGKNGTYFTVGSKGNNTYDTSAIVNSFGFTAIGDSTQVGLIAENDSSFWALFSDGKNGGILPQGALGLFGGHQLGARDIHWMIDRDGKMGVGTNAPQQALQVGSFNEAQDQFLSIKTAGGNQFKSGIKLLNFVDHNGFTLVSDETVNKFFIQRHNADTTTAFAIDRLNGNVGIGTTSPLQKLHLSGKAMIGDSLIASSANGSNQLNLLVGENADPFTNGIKFQENTTGFGMAIGYDGTSTGANNMINIYGSGNDTLITFKNGGSVGIGTVNPLSQLEVRNTQSICGISIDAAPGFTSYIDFNANGIKRSNIWYNAAQGNLQINDQGPNTIINNDQGNLGIGTSTPSSKLDVAGNVTIRGTQFANFGDIAALYIGDTQNKIQNLYGTGLQFFSYPGTTPSITLKSGNGFVGVRTTDPIGPLHVTTAGSTSEVPLILAGDAEIAYLDGNDFEIVQVDGAGAISNRRFKISSTGDVTIDGGSTTVTSDSIFKINVKPIKSVLPDLLKLDGVYHYWDTLNTAEGRFQSNRVIGIIAQKLRRVYPELVFEDENGYLSVDYSKFSMVLLQAVKEQQALIIQQNQNYERQQYEIDVLKEELKEIKRQLKDD